MMFTQKIYLAFLLIFLVQSTRIKNGLRFKDLQEKLTVDELESIKYMVQFGKINNIVDLIKKKEGNITISELAEIKGIKENSVFIYKGEAATVDGQLLNTGNMYLKTKGNFETVTNNTVVLPLEKPENLLPGSMWFKARTMEDMDNSRARLY